MNWIMTVRSWAKHLRRTVRESMDFWSLGIWLAFFTALFVLLLKLISDIGR
jgi:hypothetical protein